MIRSQQKRWEDVKKEGLTKEKQRLGLVIDNIAAYKQSFHARPDKDDPSKEHDVGQEEGCVWPCRHTGSAFVSLSAPVQDRSRSGDAARCRAVRS